MADVEQWVNLPKDANLEDGKYATSTERMGAVHISLKFAKDTAAAAKYRVVPDGKNLEYGEDELKRNVSFALRAKGAAVGAATEIDPNVPLDLPGCGGNKYTIEAKDAKGTVVSTSDTIVARRLLHYQLVRMSGCFEASDNAEIDSILDKVVTKVWDGDRSVRLLRVSDAGEVAPMAVYDVVDSNNKSKGSTYDAFLERVAKTVKLKSDKVGFAVAWVPYLAKQKRSVRVFTGIQLKKGKDKGTDGAGWELDKANKKLVITLPKNTHLWHGFSKSWDDGKKWLDTALLSFKRTGTGDASNREGLLRDATHASIEGAKIGTYGGYGSFSLDLADAWEFVEKRLELDVEIAVAVHVVASWLNGLSFGKMGAIAVADRGRWTKRDADAKLQTLLHEMGHRFGLVASGNQTTKRKKTHTPDAPGTYYDEYTVKGTTHRGAHCNLGATWDAGKKQWSGTPGCVMFGESKKGRKDDLCGECAKTFRKADLSDISR